MTITWGYVGKPSNSVPMVGYSEIERDPITRDIKLPFRIIRGPDACIQRLGERFRFFLKEWFLDQRLGVPYYEEVLVKNPDKAAVTALFRRVILDTPGFARVLKMSADLNKAERQLVCSFEALLEDPNIIVRAVDAPFKLR